MCSLNEIDSVEQLPPSVQKPAKLQATRKYSEHSRTTSLHFARLARIAIAALFCTSLLAFSGEEASAAASEVHTTVSASKNEIGVADPFNVTVEAIAPKGVTVRFPEIGDKMGDFEIVTHRDTMDVPSPEGRRYQRQLTLETLKTGHLNVPEFEVFYQNDKAQDTGSAMASVKTDSIPITVQSAIAATDEPSQFRDLKNVVFLDDSASANSLPWGLIYALGGLGILGVTGLVVLGRFPKQLTPKQRALNGLDQLSESDSLGSSDTKFVYQETTRILRTFIESQFDFPATRQTTIEFLAAVNADRRLGQPLQQRLKQFLESADMVKFAGLSCSESVLTESINQARQFVLEADEQKDSDQPSLVAHPQETSSTRLNPSAQDATNATEHPQHQTGAVKTTTLPHKETI